MNTPTLGALAALALTTLGFGPTTLVRAADPKESDYYKITTFPTPKETALEVGYRQSQWERAA